MTHRNTVRYRRYIRLITLNMHLCPPAWLPEPPDPCGAGWSVAPPQTGCFQL